MAHGHAGLLPISLPLANRSRKNLAPSAGLLWGKRRGMFFFSDTSLFCKYQPIMSKFRFYRTGQSNSRLLTKGDKQINVQG